jgi:hypothetical protein
VLRGLGDRSKQMHRAGARVGWAIVILELRRWWGDGVRRLEKGDRSGAAV